MRRHAPYTHPSARRRSLHVRAQREVTHACLTRTRHGDEHIAVALCASRSPGTPLARLGRGWDCALPSPSTAPFSALVPLRSSLRATRWRPHFALPQASLSSDAWKCTKLWSLSARSQRRASSVERRAHSASSAPSLWRSMWRRPDEASVRAHASGDCQSVLGVRELELHEAVATSSFRSQQLRPTAPCVCSSLRIATDSSPPPISLVSSHPSLPSPSRTTQPRSLPVCSTVLKIILAVFVPPLGVFLERGCTADFWINVLLTILGYIPGIIHALYIILKY